MSTLLVDDDPELIESLAFALRRAALSQVAAHDGASAIRKFEERIRDLVVQDINLGATSGIDVLKELRRRCPLPIIMLTRLIQRKIKSASWITARTTS